MIDEALTLLAAFGLEVTAEDALLVLICESVAERICNLTNQREVPRGLSHLAAEMAAGEYLYRLYKAGQLSGFDFDAAVSSIKEGDTSVSFAVSEDTTDEGKLAALIEYLRNGRAAELYRYRKLVW